MLTAVPSSPLFPRPLRPLWYRSMGASVDPRAFISPRVRITDTRLTVGARAYLSYEVFVDASDHVRIGCDAAIGMRATIVTSTHHLDRHRRRAGAARTSPVNIGDGVWIGANAVILPGVTIGAGAVVAAGSVVIEDCLPDTLYGGVPARALRALGND